MSRRRPHRHIRQFQKVFVPPPSPRRLGRAERALYRSGEKAARSTAAPPPRPPKP